MSGQMPKNISFNPVIYVRQNVLSDKSIIWEIRQRGAEDRLASSSSESEAERLAHILRATLADFENRSHSNTVDV